MQTTTRTELGQLTLRQIAACGVDLPRRADGSIVIYFADRVLLFSREASEQEWYCVEDDVENPISRAKVINFLDTYKKVALISSDPMASFFGFASQMVWVEAAGGVVRNSRQEVVMIKRNERWDLPKGHREGSESFAFCAQREAEEETGVKVAQVGKLLRTTLHSYNIYGKWELKLTAWYEMWADSTEELTPQAEEGIVAAEWIGQDRIESCINSSYPTIKEVFAALLE